MKKIKITADAVLQIVQNIFKDDDINFIIDDPEAPHNWQGKTVEKALNVDYRTFKHRPEPSNDNIDMLSAASRAFCFLSLTGIERLFSKDVDMSVLTADLEYSIQTSKIKLLEDLIENCNIATSGIRVPVTFGKGENAQTRKAVIIFGRPNIGDIQTAGSFGETALVVVEVAIMLYPDVVSYSEYTVSFAVPDENGQPQVDDEGDIIFTSVPLSSFSTAKMMTQKPVPLMTNSRKTGNINLSGAASYTLVFDGYNNPFVNYVATMALASPQTGQADNNQSFLMKLTRANAEYIHEVVIKDHQITVNADTGNETHTLSLVTRGMNSGTT